MKIYAINAVNENDYQLGCPLLTCSMSKAIKWAKHFNKEKKTESIKWIIYQYEIKTQGKNWENVSFAEKFKEPF